MARLPRLAIDHQLHLLIHRAAPGVVLTAHDEDVADFRSALLTVSREADVAIHAYSLLPDRLMLLLTPRHGELLSSMMQRLGRRYAGGYNRRHGRHGSPWQGRFATGILQASAYLLDAMCLVEGAADQHGLSIEPGNWPGCSAAHHLGRHADLVISEHPLFWALGNTPFERELAYRRLFAAGITDQRRSQIEGASLKGWVLGDASYLALLSKDQARRLLPERAGRPRARLGKIDSDPI